MFGYINANLETMAEDDIRDYKAYYCGLCRELKKLAGFKGQMLLNYDMTFLIVLLSGLYELENESYTFTCPVHPLLFRSDPGRMNCHMRGKHRNRHDLDNRLCSYSPELQRNRSQCNHQERLQSVPRCYGCCHR